MRQFVVFSVALGAVVTVANAMEPLPQAHAHNDYHHKRPLLDALDHGFCSVEADVFVVKAQLWVAHDRVDLEASRTLKSLYLDPLRGRVKQNGGRVYKDGPQFTLLIDFKSEAESTYEVLRKELAEYPDLFGSHDGGKFEPGPVRAVISGNRPFDMVRADAKRACGLDGRLKDLDSDLSSDLLPMISDNWGLHFRWRGDGPMPAAERAKLIDAVARSHKAGRTLRFWATPEKEAVWRELAETGVDHINTDQLAELESFLRGRKD